jgi:hypothetical protein
MRSGVRRRLLVLGVVSLINAGCASLSTPSHVQLQGPEETLEKSRAGRFSVQALETPPLESPRGSQGRFEWLHYRSADGARRLLLVIGPFGQSLGGIEQRAPNSGNTTSLNFFDSQGLIVDPSQQWELLSSLAGRPLQGNSAHARALEKFMRFLADATESEQRVHETELPLSDLTLRFRIAFDAQ